MRILSLSYRNHNTGWNICDLTFNRLTLLVGASGVGKTQILRSLLNISKIANGIPFNFNGIEWKVAFQIENDKYEWEGEFESIKENDISYFEKEFSSCNIAREKLTLNQSVVLDRDKTKILLNGKETVKLDSSKSAIELLKEESSVSPVYKGFSQIYELKNEKRGIRISPRISEEQEKIKDVIAIHNNKFLSPIEMLFVLYKNELKEFKTIKELFTSIFPLVEDVGFSTERFFDGKAYPILKLKERGVDTWILSGEISSGMYRTLSQITILTIAQDGDVILIDEFENGLGVNCINQLADQILAPEKDVQIIVTSHHPYIINAIPFEKWKIVTRKACDVRVLNSDELNIGKQSHHEAFMQLIQTKAFKIGQS